MAVRYRENNTTFIIPIDGACREDVDYGASFGATGISNTAGLELVGPAGGWIFYAKPSYSYDATGPFSEANGGKPWRYLECSPNYTDSATGGSTEGTMRWGRSVIVGAQQGRDGEGQEAPVTLSTDGNGLSNSYKMWAVNQNRSYVTAYNAVEATNAVAYCFGLTIGGYRDWYLPSVGEMDYVWWNLVSNRDSTNIGKGANTYAASKGFAGRYWTSSEMESDAATIYRFDVGGSLLLILKNTLYRVRAIRRF